MAGHNVNDETTEARIPKEMRFIIMHPGRKMDRKARHSRNRLVRLARQQRGIEYREWTHLGKKRTSTARRH